LFRRIITPRWPQALKYVVVGTGRCGTVYMARLLTSLGIMCGHESVFSWDSRQSMAAGTSYASSHDFEGNSTENWFDPRTRQAESSWMAVPYLRHPFLVNANVIHLIREPMKVISSLVCNNKLFLDFTIQDNITNYRNYLVQHLPQITEIPGDVNRAAYFYLRWNEWISYSRPLAVVQRIEDQPGAMIEYLGVQRPTHLYDDKTANRWLVRDKDLEFEAITDKSLRTEIIEFTKKHGYQ